jgi:hypothetical protein
LDLAQILRELSRQRRWVIVGAVVAVMIGVLTAYRPTGFPPTLEARSLELGVAQAQVILDAPDSTLLDPTKDLEKVTMRTPVYAEVMTTDALTKPIAERGGIEWGDLGMVTVGGEEPGSQERSNQLVEESKPYSMFAKASAGSPVLTILVQGPDGESSARVANAAAVEVKQYVERLKNVGAPQNKLVVTQLGRARGSAVNQGVNKLVVILATLGSFVAACLLILLGSSVAASHRRLRTAGQGWPQGGSRPAGNGASAARSNGQEQASGETTVQEDPELASIRSLRRR